AARPRSSSVRSRSPRAPTLPGSRRTCISPAAPASSPGLRPPPLPSILWMPRTGRSFRAAEAVWGSVPRVFPLLNTIALLCRNQDAPRLQSVTFTCKNVSTMQARVLAFVLAGGKGTRLFPLTKERAKPAVPFGGRYRIVDFVLSNLINSGIYSIYVLLQFR